jgi:ABC-type molybdate transport system ATPase subunit
MIEVAFRHRQGVFSLDVDFASDARLVALFGPSGAGKTTVLNVVAGLIRPTNAQVTVGGERLPTPLREASCGRTGVGSAMSSRRAGSSRT